MLDKLTAFWNSHSETLINLGYKGMLAIAIVIAKTIRRSIYNANERLQKLDATLIPILSTASGYAVYTIGGVFILDIFGLNTASLVALVGAAGLAIGLALKDTLSNIAAGIMLLILRPFRTDDFIELSSTMGTVREINLLTTILETVDGLYIASPNSVLWGSSIKNFTRNGKRRMDIVVGLAYSDSMDEGLNVLKRIAAEKLRLLQEPAPQVMVASMAESAVNFQLRAWAGYDDYWQTYWDLNKRVKESIEAAGLTIPFPQRTLHVANGSATVTEKAGL